jgi:hypothetical protein
MSDYYDFYPWEIWNGGECPCPSELVQVQFRSETRWESARGEVRPAKMRKWPHCGSSADIIAFRRVKNPKIVRLRGRIDILGGWEFTVDKLLGDTHSLTFEIVNGELTNALIERLEK